MRDGERGLLVAAHQRLPLKGCVMAQVWRRSWKVYCTSDLRDLATIVCRTVASGCAALKKWNRL